MSESNDDNSAEFSCIEPFDIDNGELDGISPQQVFVLGYEYATIRKLVMDNAEQIHLPAVNWQNKQRLQRLCIRHGRRVKFTPTLEGHWYEMAIAPTGET